MVTTSKLYLMFMVFEEPAAKSTSKHCYYSVCRRSTYTYQKSYLFECFVPDGKPKLRPHSVLAPVNIPIAVLYAGIRAL